MAFYALDESGKAQQHDLRSIRTRSQTHWLPSFFNDAEIPTSSAAVNVCPRSVHLTKAAASNLKPETIYYLAYGSNLAAETFRGRRNIHPISSVNVVVPSLRLAFDLPGVAYNEPCFANSATRKGYDPPTASSASQADKPEAPVTLSSDSPSYHKDRWKKGMVGVAYELTPSDYAHVIATEGGGASYQDVTVDCYVLPRGTDVVPEVPDTEPITVHTLFAPPKRTPGGGEQLRRPDPSYAQPSARYLKLLTDGAAENDLPMDYREYLAQIRPYRVTSPRQRIGRFIFASIWRPVLTTLFALFSMFSDENGKAPPWLAMLAAAIFSSAWASYDGFFKGTFGDGERTENEGPDSVTVQNGRQVRTLANDSDEKSMLQLV